MSELGIVTAGGKVAWGRYAQVTNNAENGTCHMIHHFHFEQPQRRLNASCAPDSYLCFVDFTCLYFQLLTLCLSTDGCVNAVLLV